MPFQQPDDERADDMSQKGQDIEREIKTNLYLLESHLEPVLHSMSVWLQGLPELEKKNFDTLTKGKGECVKILFLLVLTVSVASRESPPWRPKRADFLTNFRDRRIH